MQHLSGRRHDAFIASWSRDFLARAMTVALLVYGCGSGLALAQSGKLGAYTGTIDVSGTEVSPKLTYSARVKVNLPVSARSGSSVTAEFLAGEAPDAIASIKQWDIAFTEKSADSDGKFSSWTCALAAPVDVPMSATGVLDVDLKAKKHALSITLLSTVDVSFNCVHSRSGAYKKKQGVSLYIGTGAPGEHSQTQLPFSDASRLSANYTLRPTAANQGRGPIVQSWDLSLTR